MLSSCTSREHDTASCRTSLDFIASSRSSPSSPLTSLTPHARWPTTRHGPIDLIKSSRAPMCVPSSRACLAPLMQQQLTPSPPLARPQSYDSLRPPPSVTQWSAPGSSGYSSPAGSSVALGSGGGGPGSAAPSSQQGGGGLYGAGARAAGPPAHPNVLQKRERGTKHEVLDLGGCVSSSSSLLVCLTASARLTRSLLLCLAGRATSARRRTLACGGNGACCSLSPPEPVYRADPLSLSLLSRAQHHAHRHLGPRRVRHHRARRRRVQGPALSAGVRSLDSAR